MIKQVGNTLIQPKHRASCHCGAVVLELSLPNGIENPRRCDCSICRRKGAMVGSVPLAGIKILKGEDVLKLYEFNTKTAKHYFCSICGIYTHHQRRSNPHEYGYNIGCLEAHASGRSIEAITGKPAAQASAQVIAETGRLVARALVSVGAAVDLRSAVIAGSVALGFGKPFFESVQSELDRSAKIGFVQGFSVCPAGLGPLSPLVGAAAVARNLGCET